MNACTHVRVVGLQPVDSRPTCRCPSRRAGVGLGDGRDVRRSSLRDAGGHVVRLRHLRLRQRRHRPQAQLCRLRPRGRGADVRLRRHARSRRCCCCSGRSSPSSAPGYFTGFGAVTAEIYDTRDPRHGAGAHLQRRAASRAPWRRSWSARWPTRAASAPRSRWPRRRSSLAACFWIAIPETRGRPLT